MIFILHYVLYGATLPAATVYLATYLQSHSGASMSEIGALLKIPSLLGFLLKPLVGGLADRQQAHKRYLMGALACVALGFGSLALLPFFPHFLQEHGRLAWYASVVCVLVGASGLGLVWSLGDALALNGAELARKEWAHYKLWFLVAYGPMGAVAGQLNERLGAYGLPPFVPGMLQLVLFATCELLLLAAWPSRHFVMYGRKQQIASEQEPAEKQVVVVVADGRESGGGKSTAAKDKQLELLKFIASHDRLLLLDVLLLATLGFSANCNQAYQFLHVRWVCASQAANAQEAASSFATTAGCLMLVHSGTGILAYLLMPRLRRACGRAGTVSLAATCYLVTQLYQGTVLARAPVLLLVPLTTFEALATPVVYTLVNELALDAVNRLDGQRTELEARGFVKPGADLIELKAHLRASMQGVMSGAVDGLGGGLGTLTGGVILDYASFSTLWRLCAALDLLAALIYPLLRRRALPARPTTARLQ